MHCLILVHFCVTFDNDDIGQKALEEHKVWIELNSVQQLSIYRSLVRSHWPQINEDCDADFLAQITQFCLEVHNSGRITLKTRNVVK